MVQGGGQWRKEKEKRTIATINVAQKKYCNNEGCPEK